MEIQMDKLVQQSETTKAQEIPTVIPMVTTVVPSTLVEELAPKVPLATTVPVTSSTTSATDSSTTATQHSDEASKLVKSMEEMTLKTNEISKLQKVIDNIEGTKKLAQINVKIHEENANRLDVELKNLQKDLTLQEPISFIKNQLWKIIKADIIYKKSVIKNH